MLDFFNSAKNSLKDSSFSIPVSELKKRVKIVVIDDDKNSFPVSLLSKDGYTIEYWRSINENELARLEGNSFDIIILDIKGITKDGLSDLDGIGVLERIKRVNPAQVIIAFSGETYDIGKASFFKLADDVVTKPIDYIRSKNLLDQIINDKLNVAYFWGILSEILKKQGTDEKAILKIEKEIARSFREKRTFSSSEIKNLLLKGVKITPDIMSIVVKIIALIPPS